MAACGALAQAQPPAADEGERGLERALTRQNILVLPRGAFELEPALEYTYRGTDAIDIVNLSGTAQVARQNVKQDRVELSFALRAGLPGAMHVEVRLPYASVREERTTAGQVSTMSNGNGAGDFELGITKQIVEERASRAGWLASVNWRAPTGRFQAGEPSPGSGFASIQGALTFVSRQDPLVFFGTGSYTYVRERSHDGVLIDPGDSGGLKVGTILAASPQTSLRVAFEVNRSGRTSVNGAQTPGSDTVAASAHFGLGTLITRRSLFDVQVSIGVTPDAPDFVITAAVPIRF